MQELTDMLVYTTDKKVIIMQNIINKVLEEKAQSLRDFEELLDKQQSFDDVLNTWQLTNVMTDHMRKKTQQQWGNDLGDLKHYILKRKMKQLDKATEATITRVLDLADLSTKVCSMTIGVEWIKSRMWGLNPKAHMTVTYDNGMVDHFDSESISGCGYCKLSTAIAQVLNQCNPLIRDMLMIKDDNVNQKNHELLGYGSGYGIIPQFEGGVGESSLRGVLEGLGFKLSTSNHGKTSDFYYYELNNEVKAA